MLELKDKYILTKEHRIIDLNKYNVNKIYFDPIYINATLIFNMKIGDKIIVPSTQIKRIITHPIYAIDTTHPGNATYEVVINHTLNGVVYFNKNKERKIVETEEGIFDLLEMKDNITKAIVTWKVKGGGEKTRVMFIKNFSGKYIFDTEI